MCLFLFVFFLTFCLLSFGQNVFFLCVLVCLYAFWSTKSCQNDKVKKISFILNISLCYFFLLCFGQNVYFIFGAVIFLYAFWSTKSCQNDKDKPIFFILNMFLCKQDLATSRQFGPKGR